jgi:hypothetical protein
VLQAADKNLLSGFPLNGIRRRLNAPQNSIQNCSFKNNSVFLKKGIDECQAF